MLKIYNKKLHDRIDMELMRLLKKDKTDERKKKRTRNKINLRSLKKKVSNKNVTVVRNIRKKKMVSWL